MLRHLALALAAGLLLSGAAASAAPAAQIDPERNLSTPTGWQWWKHRSEAQINTLRADGWRLTDIEVEQTGPHRFTAAFVRNTGAYQRSGGWWFGKSRDQVVALTKDQGRRLIDLEPYTVDGKRRFAIVTVPNSGQSAKGWWWNYDLTAAQVKADIDQHKIRLIDLDTYVVGGKRRFSYVGIKNSGVDASGWWWYHNVTPAFVQQKAEQHGARLIDIERHKSGRLTVVMVKNQGVHTRHAYNMTQSALGKLVAKEGLRITDLERHGDRWWAVMIDNAGPEERRIRSILLNSPYETGFFGAFAKQVGGPTHVGLAHTNRYQPMSVMKLVPHLYVMDKLDQGQVNLDTTQVSWKAPPGKPDDVWCPSQGGETQTYSDTMRGVLTRHLWESLNRAHESLLTTYGPTAITNRVQQLGLTKTDMYYGCKYPGKKDWLSSRTTLTDMGKMFEKVDRKQVFPNKWQQVRDEFYGLMATWPKDWMRPVVEDEAAKQGKSGIVDEFMLSVQIHGKGGGADSGNSDGTWNTGRALSYRVVFPVKVPVQVQVPPATGDLAPASNPESVPAPEPDPEPRPQRPAASGGVTAGIVPQRARTRAYGLKTTALQSHVGGFFVNDMTAPCLESDANTKPAQVNQACRNYAKKMGETFATLTAEVQRTAIREALKTW